MAKYRVTYPVEDASGIQVYEVEASSEEEAIRKAGDAECVHEEIEVTHLGEPEVELIEEGE